MRTRPQRKKETIENEHSTEIDRIFENRINRFKELLGEDYPEEKLNELAASKIDYWDLDRLLKSGCPVDIALDILT